MTAEKDNRTTLLLGEKGIENLKKSTVLVAGCGAVGGFALEALARAGVGHLIVIDFDTFDETNLNRQLFATTNTIGKLKTNSVAERLILINPEIKITQKPVKISSETMEEVFSLIPDYVIDAIDSVNAKSLFLEELIKRKIPFISAMGAALKTDLSRVKVSSFHKTIECPLAAFVRQRLRRRGVSLKFPVVFSDECVSDKKALAPQKDSKSGRRAMGSLVTMTGIFGLTCAHEAILFLANKE
ncbi:MAG: tRNA threonylcarbamoyladenosine dehydratase [Alphaproteobacteria bacterium]|nr:tRNA threonylcarbamoyladenosine dehydratase [Alphaproteobacteria bacterium]